MQTLQATSDLMKSIPSLSQNQPVYIAQSEPHKNQASPTPPTTTPLQPKKRSILQIPMINAQSPSISPTHATTSSASLNLPLQYELENPTNLVLKCLGVLENAGLANSSALLQANIEQTREWLEQLQSGPDRNNVELTLPIDALISKFRSLLHLTKNRSSENDDDMINNISSKCEQILQELIKFSLQSDAVVSYLMTKKICCIKEQNEEIIHKYYGFLLSNILLVREIKWWNDQYAAMNAQEYQLWKLGVRGKPKTFVLVACSPSTKVYKTKDKFVGTQYPYGYFQVQQGYMHDGLVGLRYSMLGTNQNPSNQFSSSTLQSPSTSSLQSPLSVSSSTTTTTPTTPLTPSQSSSQTFTQQLVRESSQALSNKRDDVNDGTDAGLDWMVDDSEMWGLDNGAHDMIENYCVTEASSEASSLLVPQPPLPNEENNTSLGRDDSYGDFLISLDEEPLTNEPLIESSFLHFQEDASSMSTMIFDGPVDGPSRKKKVKVKSIGSKNKQSTSETESGDDDDDTDTDDDVYEIKKKVDVETSEEKLINDALLNPIKDDKSSKDEDGSVEELGKLLEQTAKISK